ncbi:MAG: aldehyde dehydrogenase family protein [Eubacteriaceae bacterium]|jgi:succinate-semialdehyde dehydrogenase|nr:aldehyde dehydrogenase family protein [Eubacteriaceae bacterium]
MTDQEIMDSMMQKAKKAQKEFEKYNQEQVDEVVRTIAKTVFDNAEKLARMAVDETGMGVYEDKVKKNMGKARVIWEDCKGGKSVGIIERIPEEGLVVVAKPMGVIGCITPTTNPIVTPMCNAMFAAKGRNAVIICPHPRSKKCSTETVVLINEALAKIGAPENLIQCIAEPTMELSGLVMKECDVCISTGGAGMVKAAYASGKPAFGVGPGNVQTIIDDDVDLEKVIPMIIEGRCFDNGIICSGEQTAIMPEGKLDEAAAIYEKNDTYFVRDAAEVKAVRDALFPGGVMNKDLVGRSAIEVANAAGIKVKETTKMLLVKADTYGADDYLSKEKMAPVQTLYLYDTWQKAIDIAEANLDVMGEGHSVSIHSNNEEHIEAAAMQLHASRFLINQVCSTNNGGSFFNGLRGTTTLGCGSWGNNSISENLNWNYLFNKSRIAYVKPNSSMPSDKEIWG